jgi:hypothetical protein
MPENDALFQSLQALAEDITPDAQFKFDLAEKLKAAHKPRASFHVSRRDAFQFAELALALAALAVFLSWAIRSLLPNRVPAGYETSTPAMATPTRIPSGQGTPVPQGQGFEYNGAMLYLNAALPALPTEANVYLALPDQHATVESARALALRFGIDGQVYEMPGEVPDTIDYMVTAGGPRLFVRSDNYFSYYREYGGNFIGGRTLTDEQAAASIAEFMQSHGFDFEYRIEHAPHIYGEYYIVPLLDGQPLRYDYNLPARLDIILDENAEVMSVYGALIDTQKVGVYGIRSSEEAFQQILDNAQQIGVQQTMRSGGMLNEQVWLRAYPDNEPVTLYDEVSIFQSAEAGGAPLLTIQEYKLTGNTAGLEAVQEGVFVEASGRFTVQNNIRVFEVDSWTYSTGQSISLTGTLRTEGGQFILFSNGKDYPLADIPADVPLGTQLPNEQLIVSGFLVQDRMEWAMIQYFPPGSNSGGEGGGGSEFYDLNLSGTPMPLPTPVPTIPSTGGGGGGGEGGGSGYMYTVVAGDTCQSIATAFNVSVEDLIAANGLPVDCSTLQVDQTLTIPVPPPSLPKTVEGLRGILMVNQYNRPDGSQRIEYALVTANPDYPYVLLEGDGLDALKGYRNRPVDVWGALEMDAAHFTLVVKVSKFEIPFPDLNFKILKGTEKIVEAEGQTVLLFTAEDGQTFLELNSDCNSPAGTESALSADQSAIQIETLAIPNQTWGGYPTVCVHSKVPAFDPSGQPIELQVTADQVYVMDDPVGYVSPTMTIEKVELVYYITDPRYPATGASSSPAYIQPVWRFYGHYSNGDEFEILVQALKDEFLSPVIQTVEPPG